MHNDLAQLREVSQSVTNRVIEEATVEFQRLRAEALTSDGQLFEAVRTEIQAARGEFARLRNEVLEVVDRADRRAVGRGLPRAVSRTRTCFLLSDASELLVDRTRTKSTADLPRIFAHIRPR